MLHLYITSAAYELGVQPGDDINAIAIIYRPGMYINLQELEKYAFQVVCV